MFPRRARKVKLIEREAAALQETVARVRSGALTPAWFTAERLRGEAERAAREAANPAPPPPASAYTYDPMAPARAYLAYLAGETDMLRGIGADPDGLGSVRRYQATAQGADTFTRNYAGGAMQRNAARAEAISTAAMQQQLSDEAQAANDGKAVQPAAIQLPPGLAGIVADRAVRAMQEVPPAQPAPSGSDLLYDHTTLISSGSTGEAWIDPTLLADGLTTGPGIYNDDPTGALLATPDGTPIVLAQTLPELSSNTDMSLSANGERFLYDREARPGISDRTHWPGGSSGVTLGAGYDMGGRTADQVRADLVGIGIPAETAQTLSAGATLRGEAAQIFSQQHARDVVLTRDQETALLRRAIPVYEQAVRENVHVQLNQNQYDALVSFSYNVGVAAFSNSTLLRNLNAGDIVGATAQFREWNRSGGRVMQGLVNRRNEEINLFQTPP